MPRSLNRHISKGSSWGSGALPLVWWECSTPHCRAHPRCLSSPKWHQQGPLTKLSARSCSLRFLCNLLCLFVLVRPSFLPASPSQCPASAILPFAWPFKPHQHTKPEQTSAAPSWSKCHTHQRAPNCEEWPKPNPRTYIWAHLGLVCSSVPMQSHSKLSLTSQKHILEKRCFQHMESSRAITSSVTISFACC